MVVDGIRQIDTSGNNQIDENELVNALKPKGFFSKEENLVKLGNLLNSRDIDQSAQELFTSLEQSFYALKGDILEKERITNEDKKFLEIYKRILGGKCGEEFQEIDNFIVNQEKLRRQDEEEQKLFNLILQEIETEIFDTENNYIENLKSLGIDPKTQFKRNNLVRDIKSINDLEKIDGRNITSYLKIPEGVPNDYYEFIANNVKFILNRHLQLHPDWKTTLGKGGYSTGMNIDNLWKDDVYMTNIIHQIQILEKKDITQQVLYCINKLPNGDYLDLWLKRALNNKNNRQEDILKKVFDKITPIQSNKFFKACEKNGFINELKNNYAIYWLKKYDSIKTDGGKYCFLDWTNKSKFENFYGKGIKLSDDLNFDNLYSHTKNFYTEIQKFGFDTTIPLSEIIKFLSTQDACYKKIKTASDVCEREIKQTVNDYNPGYMPVGGSPSAGHTHLSGEMYASKVEFQSEKSKACAELEKEYVKVLLQKSPKPTGEIMGISGAGIALKFNKDPGSGSLDSRAEKIVRETFTEQLGDQREKFKYDLKNDRQAAFGSAMGMIGGIAGSAVAAIFTKNIWATSTGFTMGLRLGNGIGQEIWNSGEYLYEQVSGNKINDGNNKVESFGQGFLKGVGALDQNYEYVGTAKFLSGLGFDYLSTVATFGLEKPFGGFLGKLEGIKFAGGALKFGMEELILENFFVDIPMNIVQTGFETFTGIDDGVTIGNTAIGNQHTVEGQGGYKSGSLSDMLRAIKDATTQNLSFENLSQTFFNTVIYGGFLEGGGAAIKKMKGYLSAGQVSNFTERSAIASEAFLGLTNFMSSKNIKFDKDRKCIDTSTNLEITKSDPRFKELCDHLNSVNATRAGVIEPFETIMKTLQQKIADPENKIGLLFRLGLISPTDTPLNILEKKKKLVEKKLNEAKAKGDNNEVNQLQKLLNIYTDAEAKLGNDYFDGKSHQFNVTEQQARGNSEMMDNIVRDITLENQSEKFQGLRAEITNQYKEATGEELNFTDEQLLSILDAHEQDGKLGELTLGQLKQKVKILDETITDPKVRRFLLEAGFCGKETNLYKMNGTTLGLDIEYTDTKEVSIDKYNSLTEKQRKRVADLMNLRILVTNENVDFLANIDDTQQSELVIFGKQHCGINFYETDAEAFLKLSEDQLQRVQEASQFKFINFYFNDAVEVANIDAKGKNVLRELDVLGLDSGITGYTIKNLSKLTPNQMNNLRRLKSLGYPVGPNFNYVINLTSDKIDMISQLHKMGVKIPGVGRNEVISKLTAEDVVKVRDEGSVQIMIEGGKVITLSRDMSYFDGQMHQFEVTEQQARSNSEKMDYLLNEVSEKNIAHYLKLLNEDIARQYKEATGEELNLTDEQLLSILDAHEQDGVLGELTIGQLKQKVNILDETITDLKVRRFLLEAGFCGKILHSLTENRTSSKMMPVDFGTKILTKEDFDTEFNNIEPENEKQKICLEACKKSFDDAYNELPNLLEQIKQNPSKRQELIEKFMEKYQLSINESKSDGIKWKKTLSNEQKVFFIDAYNSFIFKPLDLKYIDTSITLGGASAFVIDNSKMMDSLAEEMTPENQDIKLNDLREEISRQHTERYGKPLNLTDEQLLAVIEAHKSVGKIGDLTYSELRDKVEILISNKVEDEGVRRFLIESGFCGSVDSRVDENFTDIEDTTPNLNLSQDWVNNSLKTNENGGQRFDSGKAGDKLLKLQNKSLNQEGLTQEKVMETIEKIEDSVEKTIAKKLRASLDSKIPEGDQRVSIEDKAFMLGQSLLYLQNYRTAYPDISPKEAYELLSSNQNKILHQHLWDLNTSTSSDHGIKHILRGNMTLAEKLFEFVNEEGLCPQEEAQRRVLTMQAIIDHDLGYTNFANKLFDEAAFGKGFHMVSDHPLWSTLYVKEHADFYKKYFGEAGYNALITSIPGHSNAQLGYLQNVFNGTATLDQTVRGILSCVDCAGSPGDYKIAFMFAQKEMIGGLFNAKRALETNNADASLQSLNGLRETVESMPDGPLKDARRKGIDAFLLDVNGKLEGLTTNEEKMNKLKDLFNFKMGKFLGAYGVQTSIDEETGIPICGKSAEGGFAIQFELAGESFSYLAEQFGTKTALKSFTGVSEDYIIGYEDSHAEAFVIKLIEQVSNKGQIPGKNFDLNNIESIISEFCKSNGTEMLPISENRFSFKGDDSISIDIKSDNSGLILHGPNGVEITLKFDGKSYEGFNNSVETISEIESRIDDTVSRLDINEGNGLKALKNSIINNLADIVQEINKQYGNSISWSQVYLDKIADDIVNLDENTSVEIIKQKIKEIRYAYHFNMNTIGTSTNPVDNK